MRSASATPPATSVPGRTSANSSPPQRPALSTSRTTSCTVCANTRNARSPVGWPKRSLIVLNRSRSASTKQTVPTKRCARETSSCRLSGATEDEAALGTGRLDDRLDDHAQQQVDVVRRGERLAEPHRHLARPPALLFELVDPLLELGGHPVERLRDLRELVAPVDVD